MTPEQEARYKRLTLAATHFADTGIAAAVFAICCDLDAINASALAVRTLWSCELLESLPKESRATALEIVTTAARVGGIATAALDVLRPLLRQGATDELSRSLRWMQSGTSPWGDNALESFFEQIVTMAPDESRETREALQRLYDNSPIDGQEDFDG